MNKLILSLLLLTVILSCQNENDGTKNSSTLNDKSSEENQAKILKEKEEQQIKDSLKSVEDEKKEIESYTGNYTIPSPSGPALTITQTVGRSEITLKVKNGFLSIVEEMGNYRNEQNGTDVYLETTTLLKTEFKINKKYKVKSLIDSQHAHAFGCEYFEFTNHKLVLYDQNSRIIHDWICCNEPYQSENKCDCIISKSN
jgi:hypothetical protein